MYEKLLEVDSLRLNFNDEGQFLVNIILAFIMFGVSLGIKVENFKKIIKNPRSVIKGATSQFILLPAITFLFVYFSKGFITPSIAMGMILVAACPGGNISNFISSISRGNIELSVSLTAIATVLAIFLTPLNFKIWGGLYANSSEMLQSIEIPLGQVFQTIFILLGIPLILGMLVSRNFPILTKKIEKPIKYLSIIIFFGFVVVAFSANFTYFLRFIKYIFFIVLIHNALALSTGYFFGTITKVPRRDRRTISIETGIQNSGLALALLFNPKIFPQDINNGGMLFIAAWWGVWHIISGLTISFFWSYISKIMTHEKRRNSKLTERWQKREMRDKEFK